MWRYLALEVAVVGPGPYLIAGDDEPASDGIGDSNGIMGALERLQPTQKSQRGIRRNVGDEIVVGKIHAIEDCLPPAAVFALLRPLAAHTGRACSEADRFTSQEYSPLDASPWDAIPLIALDFGQPAKR